MAAPCMRGMKGICERQWCDLDEATLDLANVDGRIDRAADVHADVGAQSLEVPGQSVQLHLRAGSAVGEVVEGHVITKSCSQPCTCLPTKRRRQQREPTGANSVCCTTVAAAFVRRGLCDTHM